MKKVFWTMWVVALMAAPAGAEILVDGDFSGTAFGNTASTPLNLGYAGDGWIVNNPDHWTYNTTDNRADREVNNSGRTIGQLIELGAGTAVSGYTLTVEMFLDDDATSDVDMNVSLWAMSWTTQPAGHLELLSLGDYNTDPVDGTPATLDYTNLVDWDSNDAGDQDYTGLNALTWTGIDLTGYDAVGLRVGFRHRGDAGEIAYVSSGSLAVPEPATLGLLACGGLGLLVKRRKRIA